MQQRAEERNQTVSNMERTTSLDGLIRQAQQGGPSASGPAASLLGNFSLSTIIIGIIAGIVGTYYFRHGKRQGDFSWVFAGMGLWIVPFFVTGVWWLSLSCGALVCAPIFISRYL